MGLFGSPLLGFKERVRASVAIVCPGTMQYTSPALPLLHDQRSEQSNVLKGIRNEGIDTDHQGGL
jgi:hypothetical protein